MQFVQRVGIKSFADRIQKAYGRHVQTGCEGGTETHGAVIAVVEVARNVHFVRAEAKRNVGKQVGRLIAFVQRERVQKRF